MSPDQVINIGASTVYTILLIATPLLGVGLVVGLLVSIFQATTQIQEQTLAFIPKIIAIFIALVFFGPWMLTKLLDFSNGILNNLHQFVG